MCSPSLLSERQRRKGVARISSGMEGSSTGEWQFRAMNASKALFAIALIALSACTSSVKTSDDGKTTTVSGDQGSVTVGKGVDTSKLGAPVYPGAASDDNGVSFSGQQGSATMASFKTGDDFEKVYDYYKSQMPA